MPLASRLILIPKEFHVYRKISTLNTDANGIELYAEFR